MDRSEQAKDLFLSGYNCAQSVVLSFADDLKFSKELAQKMAADVSYVASVRTLGEAYLADGEVLLHGDFFPGSWLIC